MSGVNDNKCMQLHASIFDVKRIETRLIGINIKLNEILEFLEGIAGEEDNDY